MKNTDKVTLTIGQLKRLINESYDYYNNFNFTYGDVVVNKNDKDEMYVIRDLFKDNRDGGYAYFVEIVNPKKKKGTQRYTEMYVKKKHGYPFEEDFELTSYRIPLTFGQKVDNVLGSLGHKLSENMDKTGRFYIADKDNFTYGEVIDCLRQISQRNLEVLYYDDIEDGYHQRVNAMIFGSSFKSTEEQEDALFDAVAEILKWYLEEDMTWSRIKHFLKDKIAYKKI